MPYLPPQGQGFPGNATTTDVLSGVTFSSIQGTNLTGNIPQNGALNYNPSTVAQAIPAGYTTGGTIAAVGGSATAADVLSGAGFSSAAGIGLTGTMPNNGAPTFTPSESAQSIPAGYYSGGTIAAATLGAQGSLSIGATAGVQTLTITGLGFAPTKVVVVPSVTSLAGGTGKSLIGEGTTANYAFSLYDSSQDAANVYVGGTTGSKIAATLSLVAGGFSIQLASGYTWGSTNGAATSDFTWYAIG